MDPSSLCRLGPGARSSGDGGNQGLRGNTPGEHSGETLRGNTARADVARSRHCQVAWKNEFPRPSPTVSLRLGEVSPLHPSRIAAGKCRSRRRTRNSARHRPRREWTVRSRTPTSSGRTKRVADKASLMGPTVLCHDPGFLGAFLPANAAFFAGRLNRASRVPPELPWRPRGGASKSCQLRHLLQRAWSPGHRASTREGVRGREREASGPLRERAR